MPTSRRLAGLLGPTLTVMTAAESPLVQPHLYDVQTPPVVFLNGVLLFVSGLAVVQCHNCWRRDWTTLVTLTGWGLLLLGLWRMFAAERYLNAARGASPTTFLLVTGALCALGLVLTWHAVRPAVGSVR